MKSVAIVVMGVVMGLAAMGLLASGCGGGDKSQEMVVSAASSLTGAFEQLASDFETDNPDVDVLLNFDSSATLANQIDEGAPVDVFASADRPNMAQVIDSGHTAGGPVTFATNDLVIVTRPGNEFRVAHPADLASVVEAGEVVALCARSAPCGRLADELLIGDGTDPVELSESRVTRAPNARATLGAVTRGDAAAAIVYRTDALAALDAVELVELDGGASDGIGPGDGAVGEGAVEDGEAVSIDYLVASLTDGPGGPGLAAEFVELIVSERGSEVLRSEGFR